MKTLIIINEPFEKMALGRNTTLAYILAAFELGNEVYIGNLPSTGELPRDVNCSITVLKLAQKDGNILAKKYKEINQKIVKYVEARDEVRLRVLPLVQVFDVVEKSDLEFLPLKDINLVLQRIEPMKAPFPPEGEGDIDEFLKEIRNLLPSNLIFNCPIGLGDKEVTQEINRILEKENRELISIPTAEFRIGDENISQDFTQVFNSMRKERLELFSDLEEKLVLKPKNSAQTLGVFALQFSSKGFDLSALKSQEISKLADTQLYKIKNDLDEEELKEVVEILCFVQRVKSNKDNFGQSKVCEISRSEIIRKAKQLYNEEVLVQPFLEGVKSGDVRLNYLKNKDGDFYLAGSVFRSSLREKNSSDFTTAYITGGATSKPLASLFAAEEGDLLGKSEAILEILNKNLRAEYKNSTELGADFILVGDNKTALLGEINHHCQGLIPIGEAMEKASGGMQKYDGGLALVKRAIKDLMELQKVI